MVCAGLAAIFGAEVKAESRCTIELSRSLKQIDRFNITSDEKFADCVLDMGNVEKGGMLQT